MLKPDKSTGCDGKIKYPSRVAANREIRRIERYRSKHVKLGKSRLIVYSCLFCPYFHIGHTLVGNRRDTTYCVEEEEM